MTTPLPGGRDGGDDAAVAEAGALAVIVTGLPAAVAPTTMQVLWLIALALATVIQRLPQRPTGGPGPHDPGNGGNGGGGGGGLPTRPRPPRPAGTKP